MNCLTSHVDQDLVQLMALFAVAAAFVIGCELLFIVAKAIIKIINGRALVLQQDQQLAKWQPSKESVS